MLGNYKNRRQTIHNFKKLETMRRSPGLLLNTTSSQKREPVSHLAGAYKAALKVPIISYEINIEEKTRFYGSTFIQSQEF